MVVFKVIRDELFLLDFDFCHGKRVRDGRVDKPPESGVILYRIVCTDLDVHVTL